MLTEINPFELPYEFFSCFLILFIVGVFLFIGLLSICAGFWGDQPSVEIFQLVRSDPVSTLLASSYFIKTAIGIIINAPLEPLEDLEHPLLLLIRARRILGDRFSNRSCVERF